MTDLNTTISPQEARRVSRGGVTQHFHAVQAAKAQRAAENPVRAILESAGGKLIGLALLWKANEMHEVALKTEGHFDDWTAIGVAVVGLYFVMPTLVRSLFGMVRPLLPWGKKDGNGNPAV